MKSLNTKISLAGMTSFLLVAASLLGFSSVIPTVTATTATTDDDDDTTTITTTTSPQAGMIELSPQPVYQERQINLSENPINQTHIQLTTSGNGTITLPNTTETINTTAMGSLLASFDGAVAGKEVITTEDGSESATATIYAIGRFGEESRAIVISLVDTNSTGRLAPLDGMMLAGLVEFPPPPEEAALITLWEWQSGIPLGQNQFADIVVPPPSPTTAEEPSLTDTTTTTTNATTDDTTATTALPEQGEGEEQ